MKSPEPSSVRAFALLKYYSHSITSDRFKVLTRVSRRVYKWAMSDTWSNISFDGVVHECDWLSVIIIAQLQVFVKIWLERYKWILPILLFIFLWRRLNLALVIPTCTLKSALASNVFEGRLSYLDLFLIFAFAVILLIYFSSFYF